MPETLGEALGKAKAAALQTGRDWAEPTWITTDLLGQDITQIAPEKWSEILGPLPKEQLLLLKDAIYEQDQFIYSPSMIMAAITVSYLDSAISLTLDSEGFYLARDDDELSYVLRHGGLNGIKILYELSEGMQTNLFNRIDSTQKVKILDGGVLTALAWSRGFVEIREGGKVDGLVGHSARIDLNGGSIDNAKSGIIKVSDFGGAVRLAQGVNLKIYPEEKRAEADPNLSIENINVPNFTIHDHTDAIIYQYQY